MLAAAVNGKSAQRPQAVGLLDLVTLIRSNQGKATAGSQSPEAKLACSREEWKKPSKGGARKAFGFGDLKKEQSGIKERSDENPVLACSRGEWKKRSKAAIV